MTDEEFRSIAINKLNFIDKLDPERIIVYTHDQLRKKFAKEFANIGFKTLFTDTMSNLFDKDKKDGS